MSKSPDQMERNVARGLIALVLVVVAVVGMAMFSNARHPQPVGEDATIATAVTAADPSHPASAPAPVSADSMEPPAVSARPSLVANASGDPLLKTGFGHLHVASPVSYANLTVFPVYAQVTAAVSRPAKPEFAVLSEAMSNGDVQATEPDCGGDDSQTAGNQNRMANLSVPPASVTNAEEGSEHRGANLLMVTNTAPEPTYVPDGEVVPGGDQDRGAATDTVVPARSANVSLAAYCVEHGRSSGPTPTFNKDVAIAIPSVRYAMQVVGDQQPVWDAVGVATNHFGAQTESGTYHALVASQSAQAAAARYADALTAPVQEAAHGKPIGVVVAINGKIVCADLYRNSTLFAQLWPALMRSYALQAAMVPLSRNSGQPEVERDSAGQWLATLDGAPGAQTRHADLTKVARVATNTGAGIRTVAITAAGNGHLALLHEAFWTRDAVMTN